ncbi:hypothetical protein GGR01_003344 [Acetobacter oeni]|nr:hypothetical protein [Acetobacter oeni]
MNAEDLRRRVDMTGSGVISDRGFCVGTLCALIVAVLAG